MKFNSFEDLGQARNQFKSENISQDSGAMPNLEILKNENHISDISNSSNEESNGYVWENESFENVKDVFLDAYFSFNEASNAEDKGRIIMDICFFYQSHFGFHKNEIAKVFSEIEAENDIDISLFNFIYLMAKVAGLYFPVVYRGIEKYFRSIDSKKEEKNYLMSSLPKHFLEIMEGAENEEYEHSLYTRFSSESYITMKGDGVIYKSNPKDVKRIISNWNEMHKLEIIEIPNNEDKIKIDNLGESMNSIKKELSDIYSSEYSPNGVFLGIKYSFENQLIAHTNDLKTLLERIEQECEDIIKKNNPDIDSRFSKSNDLHREVDALFNEKFSFKDFELNLLGLNLNTSKLYTNYLTFWSEINIRKFLEKDIGFYFQNYTLQEQVFFLDYLDSITISEAKKLKELSEEYGFSGFRAFLSISYGGDKMGDKILTLGEKLPKDIAGKVFIKYGDIIDTVDNTEEEIKKIFGDRDIPEKVLISVKDTLLKRGAKMLSDLGDKVLDPKFKVNEKEILEELDEIKEETIILGESYVGLYKEGIKVPIENITEIEKISTKDLSGKEKEELVKVYKNGRPKTTYENEDHLKLLTEEFRQELENQDTKILNIRFNGEIIIFAVVDQKEKDTIYIGGLTFVDDVRNSAIAVSAMGAVLEEFKDYNIKALVDSKNSILRMYQKRFGFKIIKELPREENAGELYYEIERPKDKNIEQHKELKEVA